jgi:hypothetical protein
MKSARRRIDVNLEELDQVLDGARQAPLSETDYDKLKGALHALAAMLVRPRNTEKTSAVLEQSEGSETDTKTQQDINPPRHPDTDAMAPRRLAVPGRSILLTRI